MKENVRSYEIDQFEKLYALTSAKANAASVISDKTFDDNDFDKIGTLAQYKVEHREMFRDENQKVQEQDENFYVIPRKVVYKVRNGNEDVELIKEMHVLNDSAGNGLYTIMEDGKVEKTKELKDEIEFAKFRYAKEISAGKLTHEDFDKLFEFETIDQVVDAIEKDGLSLKKVQEMVNDMVVARGLKPKVIAGYQEERDAAVAKKRDDDEPQEELEPPEDEDKVQEEEPDEERDDESRDDDGRDITDDEEEVDKTEQEAIAAGVDIGMIEQIAQKYQCKPSQINIRKIEDYEKVQEDTGLNLRAYRGRVIAVRINYGFQQRYYLMDSVTLERFETHKLDNGSIEEVQDYFKYPTRQGEDGRPLRNDEGRSHITYLDENGNVKEMKYINNGRSDDMLREERQRYIAEVSKVNVELQRAIEVYQKDVTQENWLRVKDAMQARVEIDRKYRIKERQFDNQKENTIGVLRETIDETEKVKDIDDDEWGPWSSHSRNR